jgi:hypothetical protein
MQELILIPSKDTFNGDAIWLWVKINEKALCQYSYSTDGLSFKTIDGNYKAEKGTWIGTKLGIISLTPGLLTSKGYADFDFFKVEQ